MQNTWDHRRVNTCQEASTGRISAHQLSFIQAFYEIVQLRGVRSCFMLNWWGPPWLDCDLFCRHQAQSESIHLLPILPRNNAQAAIASRLPLLHPGQWQWPQSKIMSIVCSVIFRCDGDTLLCMTRGHRPLIFNFPCWHVKTLSTSVLTAKRDRFCLLPISQTLHLLLCTSTACACSESSLNWCIQAHECKHCPACTSSIMMGCCSFPAESFDSLTARRWTGLCEPCCCAVCRPCACFSSPKAAASLRPCSSHAGLHMLWISEPLI